MFEHLTDRTAAITTTITLTDVSLRLHPVTPVRAHEEVVSQIVFAIRSGLLRVGDRLPTIEALAASTHVSKPVVGEAVACSAASGSSRPSAASRAASR